MSIKHLLRTLVVCLPLSLGSLMGVPMKPEDIKELMESLNQPKVTVSIPDDSENGDGEEVPGDGLLNGVKSDGAG